MSQEFWFLFWRLLLAQTQKRIYRLLGYGMSILAIIEDIKSSMDMVMSHHSSKSIVSLMNAIGFDADELSANRDGFMTKRQRALLNEERSFWRGVNIAILILSPIAGVWAVWDGIRIGDTVPSRVGIIIFICLIAAIGFLYTRMKWKKFDKDLSKGDVLAVEGEVKLKSYRARNGMHYILYIDKQKFYTTKQVFLVFEPNEKYRIYYSPFSKSLISAELIHEPAALNSK